MESSVELSILYIDSQIVAIHKPSGMLVHRTHLSSDEVVCLQTLRDQLGQLVYPVHRLDRGTCGIVLFGLNPKVTRILADAFKEHRVKKTYQAIIRGHFQDPSGRIDRAMREDKNKNRVPAQTDYDVLTQSEHPFPIGRYPQSR